MVLKQNNKDLKLVKMIFSFNTAEGSSADNPFTQVMSLAYSCKRGHINEITDVYTKSKENCHEFQHDIF